jgi:hypothetical protein
LWGRSARPQKCPKSNGSSYISGIIVWKIGSILCWSCGAAPLTFLMAALRPRFSELDQSLLIMLKQKLIHFLQTELALPADAIAIGLRHADQMPNLLPMVLWQYGLITLEQLDKIFDWMETA